VSSLVAGSPWLYNYLYADATPKTQFQQNPTWRPNPHCDGADEKYGCCQAKLQQVIRPVMIISQSSKKIPAGS